MLNITSSKPIERTKTVEQAGQLLLHGSSLTDSSGEDHSVTANGNASANVGGPLGAGYFSFDGTGDYLSIPDSDDWNFGSGDFVIDFWIAGDLSGKKQFSLCWCRRTWLPVISGGFADQVSDLPRNGRGLSRTGCRPCRIAKAVRLHRLYLLDS